MTRDDVEKESKIIAIEKAEEEKKKPKKPRSKRQWQNTLTPSKPVSNAPARRSKAEMFVTDEDFQMSNKALGEILFEASLPKVQSDEELYQRFVDYFNRCMESHRIPTVEECMLCTGYAYQYLNEIRTGRKKPGWVTRETPSIIAWAFEIVKAYDAKMVMAGKLPQIPYIFRSKNYYNMSDRTEVQITAGMGNEQEMNADEIMKRYSVETTFTDQQDKAQNRDDGQQA